MVFIKNLETAMGRIKVHVKGIIVQDLSFNNLKFADDVDVLNF